MPLFLFCFLCSKRSNLLVLQTLSKMGYELVSGGTENHLVLVNLKNKVQDLFFTFLWHE